MTHTIPCNNLDDAIEEYKLLGYWLDMIFPADAPREVLLSKDGESLRLVASPKSKVQCPKSQHVADSGPDTLDFGSKSGSEWIVGRAGMEYRDLIPDRLGGKVIASHIRLTKGGEVPDYVHYHKVEFQMIYCVKGRIKVVYEDQGEPFWLEAGDCALQPPEIRHHVLECTVGAEVIEVSMPAEHETWVEHEIDLPTAEVLPERDFSGQRFVRHIAADAMWKVSEFDGYEARDTGISTATGGLADVCVLRSVSGAQLIAKPAKKCDLSLFFILSGSGTLQTDGETSELFNIGDSFLVRKDANFAVRSGGNTNLLMVRT